MFGILFHRAFVHVANKQLHVQMLIIVLGVLVSGPITCHLQFILNGRLECDEFRDWSSLYIIELISNLSVNIY